MKAGVNRIQGRNSNFLDFNGDGSTVLSSGNTSILINTDNIPTAPITPPNSPGTTTVVPNLTKTTGSFDSIIDIIPLTSSVSPLDIRPTASLVIKEIFAASSIPDEEDFFTLFGEIPIDEVGQVAGGGNLIEESSQNISTQPNSPPIISGDFGEKMYKKTEQTYPDFFKKAKEIARKLGNESLYKPLLTTMYHESARTFSPSISAPGNVTRGLIQFYFGQKTIIKIRNKTYTRQSLENMTRVMQLDVVLDFYKQWEYLLNGKSWSYLDIYLVTFWPAGLGKPDSYILQTKSISAENVAKQNPAFNKILKRPFGEPLTIAKLKQYYRLQGFPLN